MKSRQGTGKTLGHSDTRDRSSFDPINQQKSSAFLDVSEK